MRLIDLLPLPVGLIIGATATTLFLASGPSTLAHSKNSQSNAPSFFVVFPRYAYPQPIREIDEVDFRNLTAPFFKPDGRCCYYSAELTNGRSFVRHELESDDVALLAVNYLDPSPKHPASFAVAIYRWESEVGSASGYGAVNLYSVVNNKLMLLQQISFIAQKPGTGASFDPSTRNVTVIASHYQDDPHYCPSKEDIISFRWTGQFFQKISIRTIRYSQN